MVRWTLKSTSFTDYLGGNTKLEGANKHLLIKLNGKTSQVWVRTLELNLAALKSALVFQSDPSAAGCSVLLKIKQLLLNC